MATRRAVHSATARAGGRPGVREPPGQGGKRSGVCLTQRAVGAFWGTSRARAPADALYSPPCGNESRRASLRPRRIMAERSVPAAPAAPPLVGRDRELAALREALAAALAGR